MYGDYIYMYNKVFACYAVNLFFLKTLKFSERAAPGAPALDPPLLFDPNGS